MRTCRVAQEAVAGAEGAHRLALQEAVVDGFDGFLTELGEHGAASLWAGEIALVRGDVARLAAACTAAWTDVQRLREGGVTPVVDVGRYTDAWLMPIGSRDWLQKMKLAVVHRDAEWIARVENRLDAEGWFAPPT